MDQISKTELLELSSLRLAEARSLFASGLFSGAYYLAGYAVETALKARLASGFRAEVLPVPSYVQSIYTHDLRKLVGLADLSGQIAAAGHAVGANWAIVTQWSEQSRYAIMIRADAEALLTAIDDPEHGVLTWLTRRS